MSRRSVRLQANNNSNNNVAAPVTIRNTPLSDADVPWPVDKLMKKNATCLTKMIQRRGLILGQDKKKPAKAALLHKWSIDIIV